MNPLDLLDSIAFVDVEQCSVLSWDGKLRFVVVPPSKPSCNEFGLSFHDVKKNHCYFVRNEFGRFFCDGVQFLLL